MYVDVTVKWIQKVEPVMCDGELQSDDEARNYLIDDLNEKPGLIAHSVCQHPYTVDVQESKAAYLLSGTFKGWSYQVVPSVGGYTCRIRHVDPAGWYSAFPLPEHTSEWLQEIYYRIGQASRG